MPLLFLRSWVAFALSPAMCDLQGRSSSPQPILTPVTWGFIHCKTRCRDRTLIPGLLWHRTPSTPTCRAAGVFVTAGPQPWHGGGLAGTRGSWGAGWHTGQLGGWLAHGAAGLACAAACRGDGVAACQGRAGPGTHPAGSVGSACVRRHRAWGRTDGGVCHLGLPTSQLLLWHCRDAARQAVVACVCHPWAPWR